MPPKKDKKKETVIDEVDLYRDILEPNLISFVEAQDCIMDILEIVDYEIMVRDALPKIAYFSLSEALDITVCLLER